MVDICLCRVRPDAAHATRESRWRDSRGLDTFGVRKRPMRLQAEACHITSMEGALWYVLAGTRGGANRARILRALENRPRNANQLAEDLDLDYKTVRHHLDVLMDNDIVRNSGDDYGAVYLPTEQADEHWDTVEEIIETVG